jgi:hypothetical protein
MDEPRNLQLYQRAVEALKLLLNGPPSPATTSGPLQFHTQFGSHGYMLFVAEEHTHYLRELNTSVGPVPDVFDSVMLQRWTTVNEPPLAHEGVHAPNVLQSLCKRNFVLNLVLDVLPPSIHPPDRIQRRRIDVRHIIQLPSLGPELERTPTAMSSCRTLLLITRRARTI